MNSFDRIGETGPHDPTLEEVSGSAAMSEFEVFLKNHLAGRHRKTRILPERIDKFRVVDELGSGTFGRVYRVYDPDLHCYRAAKVPTELVLGSESLRGEFLREARNLQSIDDHPNIVRVVQAGDDDGEGRPYFVMEYCRDRSLSSWLAERAGRPVEERWAARLMAQISDGVHRIHQQQLCHRDLKPGNILLVKVGEGGDPDRPDFRPKVADLGLASVLDDPQVTVSIVEGPVGTAAYMAPEQVRGRRKEIGPASDVYGLGAMLFEVASGRRAYDSLTRGEIYATLQSDGPSPSLRTACPKASRSMRTVVETAMRKEPRYRYGSAAEMADDLRALADGRPVRGASRGRRALFFASQHRPAVAAVVVLGALGGAGLKSRQLYQEGAASAWLGRMAVATPAEVSDLVRERDPNDPLVTDRLVALFNTGEPTRSLNAALALASSRPAYADHVVGLLLALPPKDVGAIARAAAPRIPDLRDRLTAEARRPAPDEERAPLVKSRRRVNAALALFLLGDPASGAAVLGDRSDPTSRSLLVHAFGPAGVSPQAILEMAADRTIIPAVRRQLILAMGEIPAAAWPAAERAKAQALAQSLLTDEPDAGIHGAAKWLLKTWTSASEVAAIEAGLESQPGFGWRVDASGLTFVIVDDPTTGHRFEISDIEVPVRLYEKSNPRFSRDVFRRILTDNEPALGVSFLDAAMFANWFSEQQKTPTAYPRNVNIDTVPLASEMLLSRGYRLPTSGEFLLAARAGTTSRLYFGEFQDVGMISKYAFTAETFGRPGWQDVAMLKPNDLGLFDMLGNAMEITHFDGPLTAGPRNQSSACWGSGFLHPRDMRAEPASRGASVMLPPPIPSGFRLARTLGPTPVPPP